MQQYFICFIAEPGLCTCCASRTSPVQPSAGRGRAAPQVYLDPYCNLCRATQSGVLLGVPFLNETACSYQFSPRNINVGPERGGLLPGSEGYLGIPSTGALVDISLGDVGSATQSSSTLVSPVSFGGPGSRISCRRNTFTAVTRGPETQGHKGSILPGGGIDKEEKRRKSDPVLSPNTRKRASSKTFKVVNYGQVGKDASEKISSGKEETTIVELGDSEDDGRIPGVGDGDCKDTKGVRSRPRQVSITQLVAAPHVVKQQLPRTSGVDPLLSTYSLYKNSPPIQPRGDDGSKGTNDKVYQALVRRGQMYANRKRDRLIRKDGTVNLASSKVSKRTTRLLADPFITMLDLRWRWVWGIFCVAFLLTWFGFGLVWWLVSWGHSDTEATENNADRNICVTGVNDFASALLFSIETQHTIGFGTRAITTSCPVAFMVFIVQILLGIIVQCIMAGTVFAKLAKPANRAETILFSKTAAICIEDGQYYLVFRVGDMRRSQLVGCILHAFLVRRGLTHEGKEMPFHQSHLLVSVQWGYSIT